MRTFEPDAGIQAEQRRRQVITGVAMATLLPLLVLAPLIRELLAGGGDLYVPIGIFVCFAVISLLLSLRRRARTVLELEPDAIGLRAGPMHVRIPRAEILAIHELPNGQVVVRGKSAIQQISFGRGIVGYDELRAELASWVPVTSPPRTDPARGWNVLTVVNVVAGLVIAVGLYLGELWAQWLLLGLGGLNLFLIRRTLPPRWIRIAVGGGLIILLGQVARIAGLL